MSVNVKKEPGTEENAETQEDLNAFQVSLDKEFQMMLLEILGAIKIAIDTNKVAIDKNKVAIDKNKEVLDTSASDITYLVERADTSEQDVNNVKDNMNNLRSMIVTSSQTLQIISNNITNALSSQLNNSNQQGLNQFGGMGNNNFSLGGQLSALQNQQQQPLDNQLPNFGALGTSNLASKYLTGQNSSNAQKKQSNKRNNNSNKSNSDHGQKQQSSFLSSVRNSIDGRLQQSLGTDPEEQELLKEQQKAKTKMQSKQAVRPMVRQTTPQSREKDNNNSEVQDIIISDSEDDDKEPTNKRQKQYNNIRETANSLFNAFSDRRIERDRNNNNNERDDGCDRSNLSDNSNTFNRIRNDHGNESDEEESRTREFNQARRQDFRMKESEDNEDRSENRGLGSNSTLLGGLNIPSKYNLAKFNNRDQEREPERFGSISLGAGGTTLSALKAQLNMQQRFGQDNEREKGEIGRFGSLNLSSSLRDSLGKYGLPKPGNNDEEERPGSSLRNSLGKFGIPTIPMKLGNDRNDEEERPNPLGIGASLMNKYKLNNSDNNMQSVSLGRFLDVGKQTNLLSSNLLGAIKPPNQDSLLDRMRSSNLMRDNERSMDIRQNREQFDMHASNMRDNRGLSQEREINNRDVRKNRNNSMSNSDDMPADFDEDAPLRPRSNDRNNDAEEDKEMLRKKDKIDAEKLPMFANDSA